MRLVPWLMPLARRAWSAWQRRQDGRIPFGARGVNVEIVPRARFENPETIFIGSDVFINFGASFHGIGGLEIGDNVIFGPGVQIHTSNHRFEAAEAIPYDHHTLLKRVRIGSHTWIGAGAMIAPGVTIGEGAIVAMGAVVTHDVAPCTVVGGNPARVIKERDRARYERLKAEGKFYMRLKREPGHPGPFYERGDATLDD